MKTTQQYEQKREKEKDVETFEKKQYEAFQQFMNAHFGDPNCQDCITHYFG